MKFRIIMLIIMCLISLPNSENDCETYRKLEIKDVPSIDKSDLPEEFSDEAFKVVDEFIRKTNDLNYEILLYFDYITGEVLKCKIGSKTTVELQFEDNEFDGKHVTSIHNHTKDMYTPPSDANFGIFLRKWEDYELIPANDCLWILKGKIKDKKLNFELRLISQALFNIALETASEKYEDIEKIGNECDEEYGKLLSKFINDKNINEIQLTKKGYNHD